MVFSTYKRKKNGAEVYSTVSFWLDGYVAWIYL